ncbi:hypothetical protein niasHT_007413 [Heterodera trifolii]|uniref:T-box domain-containing protein n=1 Tax=Heterodera trifolii TaxID=157864 RepID=A0ABD2LLW5_9BILA
MDRAQRGGDNSGQWANWEDGRVATDPSDLSPPAEMTNPILSVTFPSHGGGCAKGMDRQKQRKAGGSGDVEFAQMAHSLDNQELVHPSVPSFWLHFVVRLSLPRLSWKIGHQSNSFFHQFLLVDCLSSFYDRMKITEAMKMGGRGGENWNGKGWDEGEPDNGIIIFSRDANNRTTPGGFSALFFNDTWQMANDANNFLEGSSFPACPHLPLVKEEEKLSNGTASSPAAPPAAFRPGTPCAASFGSVPTSSSSSTSSCFSSPVNNSSLALPSSFPPLPPCSSSSAFLAQMAVFSSIRPELFGPLLAAASLPQRPLGPPSGVGVPSLPLRFDFNAAAAAAALHSAAPHIPIGNFGPPFRSIELVEDGIKDAPQVELEDQDLWAEFHRLVNEMIITKSGRRIFPAIKVKLSGLDKKANYYVIMDIAPWDANRWKFHNSRWTVAGKADPEGTKPLHIHPDSPASGEHWMSKGASFHRVKVTNNMTNRTEFTVLNSMHKYRPRIHIVRSNDIYSMKVASWTMVTFPETEFIAVTAYQNNLVTDKKIDHNPFAKGFRDCGAGKREKKRQLNAAQHSHALHHAHHGANNANAATVERVLQGDYSEESEESETEDGAGPSRAKRPKSGLSSSSESLSPAVAGGEERRRQCHSTANNSNGVADSFPTQHNGMGHGNGIGHGQSHAAALLHHLHAAAPFAHPSASLLAASAPLGPRGAAASVPSRPFLPHPLMVFPSAASTLPPPHFFPLPNGTSVPSSSPSSSSELTFPPHFPPAFVAHPPPLPPLFNMQQFLFFHQHQQQKQQQLQLQMMAKRKKETEEAKKEERTEGKREGKAEEKRDKKPTPGGTKRKAQFDVDSLLGEEEKKAWKSEE